MERNYRLTTDHLLNNLLNRVGLRRAWALCKRLMNTGYYFANGYGLNAICNSQLFNKGTVLHEFLELTLKEVILDCPVIKTEHSIEDRVREPGTRPCLGNHCCKLDSLTQVLVVQWRSRIPRGAGKGDITQNGDRPFTDRGAA